LRERRIFPVPAGAGESAFGKTRTRRSLPATGVAPLTYAAEGKLDGGKGHENGWGFRKGLEILCPSVGSRPNQEKVRSITQRRGGTTKPFVSARRLTISNRSLGTFATAASRCIGACRGSN
jgi:hypothetical protein